METIPNPLSESQPEPATKSNKKVLVGGVVIALLLIIAGGMYYAGLNRKQPEKGIALLPQPTATVIPGGYTVKDESNLKNIPPFLFKSQNYLYEWNGEHIVKIANTVLGTYHIANDYKHAAWIDAAGVQTPGTLDGINNGRKITVKDLETGEQNDIKPSAAATASGIITDFTFVKGDPARIAYTTGDGKAWLALDGNSSPLIVPLPKDLERGFSSVESSPYSDLLILNCLGYACNDPITYNLTDKTISHGGEYLIGDYYPHIWMPDGDSIYSYSSITGPAGLWITSLSKKTATDITQKELNNIGYAPFAYSPVQGFAGVFDVFFASEQTQKRLKQRVAIYYVSSQGEMQKRIYAPLLSKLSAVDEPNIIDLTWIPGSSSLAYVIQHSYIKPEAKTKKELYSTDTYTVYELWTVASDGKSPTKVLSNAKAIQWLSE
jgi:hypothetical protein